MGEGIGEPENKLRMQRLTSWRLADRETEREQGPT